MPSGKEVGGEGGGGGCGGGEGAKVLLSHIT